MVSHLDPDDIVWALYNTLCTWTCHQQTPWYLWMHSNFLEYHSIFYLMLCKRVCTSIDNFFNNNHKTKNADTYFPRFSFLVFRCVGIIIGALTNISTQIFFILVHLEGTGIYLDGNFWFTLAHWSNYRIIFFIEVLFLIILSWTLRVHHAMCCKL